MRIYVAGSSRQLERVKAAMAALRSLGHTITHDWVALVEEYGEANPVDAATSTMRRWAADDLAGVYNADMVWLLMPETEGFGAAVEMGYAIAHGVPVIVSGAHARSVFTSLASCYDRDDLALAEEFALPDPAADCDCTACVAFNKESN